MHKGNLVLIAVIVLVGASIISSVFLAFTSLDKETTIQTVNQTTSFAVDGMHDLSIEGVSTDIRVLESDDPNITVHHEGSCEYISFGNRSVPPEMTTQMDDGVLAIKVEHQDWNYRMITLSCDYHLDVWVPAAFAGNVSIKTVSGDVDIGSLDLEQVRINGVSADVASVASTDNAIVETVSGDVSLSDAKQIDIHTTSGDVAVDGFTTGSVATVSGDVALVLPADAILYYETVSGKLSGQATIGKPATVTVHTTSGDLRVS